MPPKARRPGGIQQRLARKRRERRDDEDADGGDGVHYGGLDPDEDRHGDEGSAAVVVRSHLAATLLFRFAWGNMSPQSVQELAKSACRDMVQLVRALLHPVPGGDSAEARAADVLPELNVLASLGCSGQYPNKVYKELMDRTQVFLTKACEKGI